jgi:hypothetical protein
MKTPQFSANGASRVTTEVVRSAEPLDFDAWARRLVDLVLVREGVPSPSSQSAA